MLPKGKYSEPDQASLIKEIERCADELKEHAIGKRVIKRLCSPIYPSLEWAPEDQLANAVTRITQEVARLRKQLDDAEHAVGRVVEESRQLVEHNWVGSKAHLVPGDVLLDNVCKKFGVRFKKDVDGSKLAALLTEQEIDSDIKRIIHSFVL